MNGGEERNVRVTRAGMSIRCWMARGSYFNGILIYSVVSDCCIVRERNAFYSSKVLVLTWLRNRPS